MDQQNYAALIYTFFYPGVPLPARNLDKVRGINRDSVLRCLVALKTAVARHRGPNIKHPFIQRYADNLPKGHRERLTSFLNYRNHAYYLTVPVIITQIITDILNEPKWEDDRGKNNEHYFTVAILDLIMIYNDHHFKVLEIGKREDSYELMWEILLMQEINGYNTASFVRSGIVKQAIFLEFLRSKLGDSYEDFEKEVASLLGIKSIDGYPVMFLFLQFAQDKTAGTPQPLVVVAPTDEIYSFVHHAGLVIDVDASERKYDAGRVMMHPFLKLSDQRLYLLDTHDFSLIADKGWIFYLFGSGKLGEFFPKITSVNSLQSFIGFDYIEKFLMVPLLQWLDRPGMRVIPSDDQYTPDVTLISNEKDVFMIEIKSVSLNYRVWQEQQLDKFKEHLEKEYISEKKGMVQLHKCIKHLTESPEVLFGLRKNLKRLHIYPIIIYTEPHLNIAGVNDYLIENSPALNSSLVEQFHTVHPLTMIHYDFFVENIGLIKQNKAIMKDAILYYHGSMKKRKQRWKAAKSTANYLKSMAPFDDFIAGYNGFYQNGQESIAKNLNMIFNPKYK